MNPCNNQHHKRRYDRQWAEKVVTKLVVNYTRATEIIASYSPINPQIMAYHLSNNDGIYPIMRDCIKYLDRYIGKWGEDIVLGALERYTTRLYSAQRVLFDEFACEKPRWDLTEFRTWLSLNSQGFRGGTRGTRAARCPPSYHEKPKEQYIR